MSNIYVLSMYCSNEFETEVGSIGVKNFDQGFYAYVGSASNLNFSRLSRHKEVSEGFNNTTHWHIDYLIKNPDVFITGAFITRSSKECKISNSINMDNIEHFGCSDCNCESHLYYDINPNEYFTRIKKVFENNSSNYQFIPTNKFDSIG